MTLGYLCEQLVVVQFFDMGQGLDTVVKQKWLLCNGLESNVWKIMVNKCVSGTQNSNRTGQHTLIIVCFRGSPISVKFYFVRHTISKAFLNPLCYQFYSSTSLLMRGLLQSAQKLTVHGLLPYI